MGAWVEIIDTRTGEVRRYWDRIFDGGESSVFDWAENNLSCDCTRAERFAMAAGDDDPDLPCGDGLFHVPRAIMDDGSVVEIDGER